MWLVVVLMCIAFVLTGVILVSLTQTQLTQAHHSHRTHRT